MSAYYKKQVEIAREFGVSEATVINWIKGSLANKNNLQLTEIGEDHHVLKNENNRVEMLNLAEKGRKFRRDESEIDVEVRDELYEVTSEGNLTSLIKSLVLKSEIPYKYDFLGEGGDLWHKFFGSLDNLETYIHNSELDLWENALEYLKPAYTKFKKINIIDLGPGNFDPASFWVKKIHDISKMGYYIPIDISPTILKVATENLKKTYSSKYLPNYTQEGEKSLDLNNYLADFEKDSLEKIINKHSGLDAVDCLNVFLFLGGTIGNTENQVRTLQNIRDAMRQQDFLVITNPFDTIFNRTIFPVSESKEYENSVLYLTRLLSIEEDYFRKEFRYNQDTKMREYNLVLNRNINLNFKKLEIVVELKKDQRINVWKHRRDDFDFVSQKMSQAGLSLQFVAKHPTDAMMVYVAKAG